MQGWLWWLQMRNAALSDSPAARNGSLQLPRPLSEYTLFSSKAWPRSFELGAYSNGSNPRFQDPKKLAAQRHAKPLSEELAQGRLALRRAMWSFIENIPGRSCEASRAEGFVSEGDWWPGLGHEPKSETLRKMGFRTWP